MHKRGISKSFPPPGMATVGQDLSMALECPCCLEILTVSGPQEPRILPHCGHSLCLSCITLLADSTSTSSRRCPVCRATLPAGPAGLWAKKNLTLTGLMEALSLTQSKTPSKRRETLMPCTALVLVLVLILLTLLGPPVRDLAKEVVICIKRQSATCVHDASPLNEAVICVLEQAANCICRCSPSR